MHTRAKLIILGALLMLLSACGSKRAVFNSGEQIQEGVASWYGPGFHGKKTANGETYDQSELTAAHRTLPFNSIVRVTNTRNGRSVVVRINDRGPYVQGRIIDLSKAAADQLDMVGPGLAHVRLTLLQTNQPVSRRNIDRELFTVQVASYEDPGAATVHAARIRDGWVASGTVRNRQVYRVFVGTYTNKRSAEHRKSTLARSGVNGFVKQLQN